MVTLVIELLIYHKWVIPKLLFTNLSKVYPGPCTRIYFFSDRRITQTVCIILSCVCQRSRYQCWWSGSSSSHAYPFVSSTVSLLLLEFLFYKVSCPTPWIIRTIPRTPLQSWGFYLMVYVFNVLRGGYEVAGEIDCAFHAIRPWGSVPIFLGFLSLVAGCYISFNRSVLVAKLLNSCPSHYLCKEVTKFSEWLLRNCKQCTRISAPCLLFSSSLDKNFSRGCLTFFMTGFSL